MIPADAPHEEHDFEQTDFKKLWKENKKALLARWTTDFDCGYETNWWYVVKDEPFDMGLLDSKARKHIRQSLKKVYVKQIQMAEYAEDLCVVHNNACRGYSNFKGTPLKASDFAKQNASVECWAAFSKETNVLVGYMTCKLRNGYVETITAKYDPQYLNLRASDAIHYTILEYYLNQKGYVYVCSGSRSISHTTNAQEYKIATFGFRKAYCKLHIEYRPTIRWIVKCLFPFRNLLKKCDSIGAVHKINGILQMEEILRQSDI